MNMDAVQGLQALRTFRALRPLRLISRFESLKQVVDTLLRSVPAMSSLVGVAMLFFCIFGILGMTLFGGRFGSCVDPNGDGVTPGWTILEDGTYQSDYDECMAIPKYNISRHDSYGILLSDPEICAKQEAAYPGAMAAHTDPCSPEKYRPYYEFPQWMEPGFGNFNNIGWAILLLFEIAEIGRASCRERV